MFDVAMNIKKLVNTEALEGMPFAYDQRRGKQVKTFGVVQCVARNPLVACGVDGGYFRRQKANPQHVCDRERLVGALIYKDVHRYEVVRENIPTRLFFNLSWTKSEEESDARADQRVDEFIARVRAHGRDHDALEYVVILTRDLDYARSYLVVFPNAVLPNTKTDILAFVNDMHACTNSLSAADARKIVDMTVYRGNRMLLMWGQSEYTSAMPFKAMKWRDPLTNTNDDSSSQRDTLVQGLKDLKVNSSFTGDVHKVRLSLAEEKKRLLVQKCMLLSRNRARDEEEAANIISRSNCMFTKDYAKHRRRQCVACELSKEIASRLFREIRVEARREKAKLTRRAKAAKVKKMKALIKRRKLKKTARNLRKETRKLSEPATQLPIAQDLSGLPLPPNQDMFNEKNKNVPICN